MADNKVAVSEKDIIQLLRDFLEETGRIDCLVAFEKHTGSHPTNLPQELAALREIVLSGRLDELQKHLFELFRELGDEDERQRCRYAVVKQQYLELLLEVSEDTAESLKQLVFQMESLCPSKEELKILLSLLTLPSFDHVPEYKGWTVLKGRMECFNLIASWMNKLLGTNTHLPPSSSPIHNLPKTRLVQLLAKGLLYEQCEAVCASSQAKENRGTGKVLDLYNWIKHQPDSAFQLSPASVQVVVTTESGETSKNEDLSNGHTENIAPFTTHSRQSSSSPAHAEMRHHTSGENELSHHTKEDGDRDKVLVKKEEVVGGDTEEDDLDDDAPKDEYKNSTPVKKIEASTKSYSADSAVKESDGVTEEQVSSLSTAVDFPVRLTEVMMKFDDNFIDGADDRPEAGPGHHRSEVNLSGKTIHQDPIPSSSSAPVLQRQSVGVELHKKEENTNFVKETPVHTVRKGRKSSTPKPSSSQQLTRPPSPSTSPVPHLPPSPGVSEEERCPTARRQIDFTENDESIIFPTAQLLAHVKDKQVVRSVAFSESGDLVAIGANSRTLRLCSTEPLLQDTKSYNDEHLPVFYCAQNYHKGSVYCMAWYSDSLLASGSNDQTIRLLSYDPSSQLSLFTTLGQIKCHKGTVRDLTFTSDGLLVSGGVGDNLIKISNPETGQVVNTLYGHYDQILGLYAVRENTLASASQDKTVRLWDLRLGSSYATVKHPHPVTSVAANIHRNQLASAQLDGSCMIHDLTTLEHIATYNAHSDECRTVRYSSFDQGRWLLSSSYDGTVCLADTKSWEWQQVAQHRNKVVQCRWHGTAPLFASTGADNRASFWRLVL